GGMVEKCLRGKRSSAVLFAVLLTMVLTVACGPSENAGSGGDSPGDPAGDSSGAAPYEGEVLLVATWGGSWKDALDESVGEAFRVKTGAEVEYFEGNPQDHRSQLIAAGGD